MEIWLGEYISPPALVSEVIFMYGDHYRICNIPYGG